MLGGLLNYQIPDDAFVRRETLNLCWASKSVSRPIGSKTFLIVSCLGVSWHELSEWVSCLGVSQLRKVITEFTRVHVPVDPQKLDITIFVWFDPGGLWIACYRALLVACVSVHLHNSIVVAEVNWFDLIHFVNSTALLNLDAFSNGFGVGGPFSKLKTALVQ